ncbi:MAG: hypothetical protein CMJ46_00735 [Planctomyces sp.]|nr:hypothetical protein [Planctomyces sp.]
MLKHSKWRAHSVRLGVMYCLLTMLGGCSNVNDSMGNGVGGGTNHGCMYISYHKDNDIEAIVILDGPYESIDTFKGASLAQGNGGVYERTYILQTESGDLIKLTQRGDEMLVQDQSFDLSEGRVFLTQLQKDAPVTQLPIHRETLGKESIGGRSKVGSNMSYLGETNLEVQAWMEKYGTLDAATSE